MNAVVPISQLVKDGVLTVMVVPNASRSEIRSVEGGVLKVALNAPAREGEANAELLRFLRKEHKLRGVIIHGAKRRLKQIRIE